MITIAIAEVQASSNKQSTWFTFIVGVVMNWHAIFSYHAYCIQFHSQDDQASYISGTVQNDTVVIDYILCGNNFMVTDRNVVLSLHGYYIHNSVWIAAVGEELPCE